jgi:four helix bundle protein
MKQVFKRPVPDIRERTPQFALRIIQLCQHLEARGGVARTIGWQLLRSGTAMGANVEEARSAESRADFISKNAIALKEARETDYWLRLLAGVRIIAAVRLADLLREAGELKRIPGAIIVPSKRRREAGDRSRGKSATAPKFSPSKRWPGRRLAVESTGRG